MIRTRICKLGTCAALFFCVATGVALARISPSYRYVLEDSSWVDQAASLYPRYNPKAIGKPDAILANTTNNYTGSGTGSLLTPGNWSLGHIPTVSEDAVFTATTGIRTLTSGALTVGSFNVTAGSGTFSIRNDTATATNSTLTLGGAGALGNGVSGTAADLLFAASGSTFNIIGPNGSTGSGVLNVVLGQSGNFNAAGTMTISSVISDGGNAFGITKTGAGTLTLSGVNTYSGGTTISAGTLALGNATNTLLDTGAVTVSGGTLSIGANSDTVGTITLTSGSITGSGGTLTSSSYDVRSGTISAGLGGSSAALTKSTSGTVTLSGINTYTGATTVNAGTLQFGQRVSLYNAGAAAAWTASNIIVGSGATAAFNVGGTGEFTSGDIDTLKGLGTATGGFKSGSFIGFDTTNSTGSHPTGLFFQYSSDIANPGGNALGVVKLGSNNLWLSGTNNTFTGGLIIKSGAVIGFSNPTNFGGNGTGNITLGDSSGSANTTLNIGNTYANPITVASGNTGIATITTNNNSGLTNLITLNNHDLTVSVPANVFTWSGGVTGTGNLLLINSGGMVLTSGPGFNNTGTITNSGGTQPITVAVPIGSNVTGVIQNSATSQLNLTTANSYTGTTVSAGTLQVSGSGTLGSTSGMLTVNGGTLDLTNTNQGVGNLTGTGGTILSSAGSSTLTIGNGNGTGGNYQGIISGAGSGTVALTKTGTGTITLSGVNSYTGATTVNAGTLLINGNQSSANGAVSVNNSGTILGGTGTIGGKVTVSSGAVILGGTGSSTSQTLTVSNTSTGAITLLSGSIIELALGASGTHSTLAHTGAGTIVFDPNQIFTFVDLGATTGIYDNIITGTGLSGTMVESGWSISNSGWAGTFTLDGSGNIDLNLIAVPEPSTWLAAALTLAAIAYTQRRRLLFSACTGWRREPQ